MTEQEKEQLLQVLETRFYKQIERHPRIDWSFVQAHLVKNEIVLDALFEMERTEGEPDVVEIEEGVAYYVDCSAETPKGRRSVCYDDAALESRKQHKPAASAVGLAKQLGIELLSEEQYRKLQSFGEFDKKTSSWVQTPAHIRALGGALFCDRRYDTVFMYHNGAESYYSSRSFRGYIKL